MKSVLFLSFCISVVFGRTCFQTGSNNPKSYGAKSYGECASSNYCFTADLISQKSGEQVIRGCGGGDILTHGYGVQSCDEFGESGEQSVNNNGISGRLKCCKRDFCNSTPPNAVFGITAICFELNGTTLRGNRFTRLIDNKISLSSIGIKGNVSDPEIYSLQNASLSFYITNYGASDYFNLIIKTNKDIGLSFYQKTYFIDSNASENDTVEISILDKYVFSIQLELTATAQSTPSITVQQNFFISILHSDDDIDAPICNIISDGNETCPDDCDGHKYDVEIEFYDDGTGVERVYTEDGEWNIPNITSGTTTKYNASGKLDCCTEISKFFVFDKNGLIGRCIFENNVKTISTSSQSVISTSPTATTTSTTSGSSSYNTFMVFLLLICNFKFSF